jgi:hypothetical protein
MLVTMPDWTILAAAESPARLDEAFLVPAGRSCGEERRRAVERSSPNLAEFTESPLAT